MVIATVVEALEVVVEEVELQWIRQHDCLEYLMTRSDSIGIDEGVNVAATVSAAVVVVAIPRAVSLSSVYPAKSSERKMPV